jgi:signal transduction histidine kinase/CheY-like chemotaxis protein
MGNSRLLRSGWVAPVGVGILGVVLSLLAFWSAQRADQERVRTVLELRADWRARDLEAKIRMSGNAVENLAIAMAATTAPDAGQFKKIAARAHRGLDHVNSLQWAPRVPLAEIAAFEALARSLGQTDYRLFDVSPDFQPTELSERSEYFPVLFDERFHGGRPSLGLALGKYEGRRIPMETARDQGGPVATAPVRPIGPQADTLVYLLFWPVYDGVDVPAAVEERQAKLRGYALGNYNLIAMLTAAIVNTPDMIGTLQFSVGAAHQTNAADVAAAHYSPDTRRVELGPRPADAAQPPAARLERDFTVFNQHWDLTFDFSADAVAGLRSQGAFGWLIAGLLLTGSMVFYLLRERVRTREIEALVEARTAELARTGEQLHQAQKMEAIGNMTGGMAHDFNNLLAVVIGNLDLLQDRVRNDPEAVALAEAALQASTRGADLTRQLLAFARRQPLAPRIIDINELVIGMTRLLERILEEHIEVVLITAPDAWPVLIDASQLNSAIANLATNARDAMPNGGRLTIETRNTHLDADYVSLNPEAVPGDYVLLEVSDTGAGMSAETLARVFEPFFTTKETGRGTGLGLSMVFGFVKQSQGHIKIYSEPEHGTTVRIYLPRAEKAETVAAVEQFAPPKERPHESILVVEDNDGVRNVVSKQLGELGYKVIEVDRPQRALELLNDPALRVDLLFTDLVMPGMNGAELAEAAAALRPELRVLFTSGYSGSSLLNDARLRGRGHFLSKPYRKLDLARKLRDIFDR